jgi:hypothetical protein
MNEWPAVEHGCKALPPRYEYLFRIAQAQPQTPRHPEVLAAQRQASKDASGRKRRSFETPRKGAAPQDDELLPLD